MLRNQATLQCVIQESFETVDMTLDKILGRQEICLMGLANKSNIKKTLVNAVYKLGILLATQVVSGGALYTLGKTRITKKNSWE